MNTNNINESKTRAPWKKPKHRIRHKKQSTDELYQSFTEKEKELNDMFVKKFGRETEQIKINPRFDNFEGTEAECKSFRMKNGIVWFKNIYGDDANLSTLCNVDEEYNAIFYNDPVYNYNTIKSWCENTNFKRDAKQLASELAKKYDSRSHYFSKKDKTLYSCDIYLKEPFMIDEENEITAFYTYKNHIYITDGIGDGDVNSLSEEKKLEFLDYISDENNLIFNENV